MTHAQEILKFQSSGPCNDAGTWLVPAAGTRVKRPAKNYIILEGTYISK